MDWTKNLANNLATGQVENNNLATGQVMDKLCNVVVVYISFQLVHLAKIFLKGLDKLHFFTS